jgi:hypothetical protein
VEQHLQSTEAEVDAARTATLIAKAAVERAEESGDANALLETLQAQLSASQRYNTALEAVTSARERLRKAQAQALVAQMNLHEDGEGQGCPVS